ncbi:MAG: arginase [Terriglobia bacterium]|nr:MAG: arginase [Terriglobia bacterium]
MSLHDDPHWPRASAWVAGDCLPQTIGTLAIVGAPVARGSITPGRCDLAPAAIRKALQRFTTYDLNTGRDVRLIRVEDGGDLDVAALTPEEAFERIVAATSRETRGPEATVLLGGDNSITRPGVHSLGAGVKHCGLLTLDAHFDLRHLDAGLTNGNPVRALLRDGLPGDHIFQIGLQSFANSEPYASVAWEAGIHVATADCVRERGIDQVLHDALAHFDERVESIYVDLDLDVLDRIYAPATPGARPGGLTPAQLRRAAHMCGAHPKVRALDLVEIDPTQDLADVTVLTAAACLLEFASGVLHRLSRE